MNTLDTSGPGVLDWDSIVAEYDGMYGIETFEF